MAILGIGCPNFFVYAKNQSCQARGAEQHGTFVLEFGRWEVPCTRVARLDPFRQVHLCYPLPVGVQEPTVLSARGGDNDFKLPRKKETTQ